MTRLRILLAFSSTMVILCSSSFGQAAVTCGNSSSAGSKIVGGLSALDGQFPYQVSLRLKNRHFCGGSILAPRWILTAAHCLSGFNDTAITAVTGSRLLSKGGNRYKSVKAIPHELYNSLLIRNDIGLLKLERDIEFGPDVQPVKLPTQDFDKADYPAILSGWGTTSYPGDVPNELQCIQLRVIDQLECQAVSIRVTHRNICTLNKKGQGACHGDSGGPLVSDDVQIGVVSWGTPCAKGRPDVFTRVYSYLDWIQEYVGDLSNTESSTGNNSTVSNSISRAG
ncbi:chymotrypsin-2-like [Trichogramma pretiosum]|uniref:chymotrypsin-2-like n=1 Tax=Trichogramma pretiosum TaxID=7493 RepID=UPI0006C980DA|nr:chymotrypsin-2-like [Trichogramma pretiosum]